MKFSLEKNLCYNYKKNMKKIERYLSKMEEIEEEIEEKKEEIPEKTEEVLEENENLKGNTEKTENIQVQTIGTGFEKTYLIIGASFLVFFLSNFFRFLKNIKEKL